MKYFRHFLAIFFLSVTLFFLFYGNWNRLEGINYQMETRSLDIELEKIEATNETMADKTQKIAMKANGLKQQADSLEQEIRQCKSINP